MGYAGQQILSGLLNSAFGPTRNPAATHVDKDGNITDAQGNHTTLYKPQNWFSRGLSPSAEQAYLFDQQHQLAPMLTQQSAIDENNAGLNVGRSNYGLLDPNEKAGWGSADRFALGNGRNLVSPTTSLTQGTALGDIDKGVIPTNVGSDIATSQLNLANAKGALGRQPVIGATQDQAAVNSLNQATQNDPLRLNLEHQQLGGAVGREPTVEELQNNEVAGQLARQPYTLGEQMGQAKVGNATANEMAKDIPNTVGTLHNQSVLGNYESQFENPSGILSPKVSGNTVGLGRTLSPTSAQTMQATMGGMNGQGGNVVTLPSGPKGIATPMYTAPTGATDEAKQRAMTGGTGNGGMGAQAISTSTPPITAGGASAKTDDYASLMQAANQAAAQYGRNSPQYADALAKIHSVEEEQMPSALGDDGNASLPFALGSLANQGAHGLGKLIRTDAGMASYLPKKLYKASKGLGKSFLQGLSNSDDE